MGDPFSSLGKANIDMNQREKRLRISASETVLLLLLGAMVVVSCEGSALHNRADTSPEATTENANGPESLLLTEGLTMWVGGQLPGTDRGFYVQVPARMHQE
ncbi:MAG TPA: hypothetical protein DD670_18350, partial [Planctomycetaceae bacterium]|nr:hypothetical protein [Planctomycetaceae bacterium]